MPWDRTLYDRPKPGSSLWILRQWVCTRWWHYHDEQWAWRRRLGDAMAAPSWPILHGHGEIESYSEMAERWDEIPDDGAGAEAGS